MEGRSKGCHHISTVITTSHSYSNTVKISHLLCNTRDTRQRTWRISCIHLGSETL